MSAIISSEAWRASASLGSCRAALRWSPTKPHEGENTLGGGGLIQKTNTIQRETIAERCLTSVGLKQSTSRSWKQPHTWCYYNCCSDADSTTPVSVCVLPWPWLPAQRHWAYPAVHPRLSPALGWPPPGTREKVELINGLNSECPHSRVGLHSTWLKLVAWTHGKKWSAQLFSVLFVLCGVQPFLCLVQWLVIIPWWALGGGVIPSTCTFNMETRQRSRHPTISMSTCLKGCSVWTWVSPLQQNTSPD